MSASEDGCDLVMESIPHDQPLVHAECPPNDQPEPEQTPTSVQNPPMPVNVAPVQEYRKPNYAVRKEVREKVLIDIIVRRKYDEETRRTSVDILGESDHQFWRNCFVNLFLATPIQSLDHVFITKVQNPESAIPFLKYLQYSSSEIRNGLQGETDLSLQKLFIQDSCDWKETTFMGILTNLCKYKLSVAVISKSVSYFTDENSGKSFMKTRSTVTNLTTFDVYAKFFINNEDETLANHSLSFHFDNCYMPPSFVLRETDCLKFELIGKLPIGLESRVVFTQIVSYDYLYNRINEARAQPMLKESFISKLKNKISSKNRRVVVEVLNEWFISMFWDDDIDESEILNNALTVGQNQLQLILAENPRTFENQISQNSHTLSLRSRESNEFVNHENSVRIDEYSKSHDVHKEFRTPIRCQVATISVKPEQAVKSILSVKPTIEQTPELCQLQVNDEICIEVEEVVTSESVSTETL